MDARLEFWGEREIATDAFWQVSLGGHTARSTLPDNELPELCVRVCQIGESRCDYATSLPGDNSLFWGAYTAA
jgi:hypothetical protein